MLLYFAPCRPLARPHRRPRQNLPCLQYSCLVPLFILRTRWIPKKQGASACCPLRALHIYITHSHPLSPLSPACSSPSGCFFARDYSHAGGPVRRARLFIYWRVGAVTIWAPRFRRCCATRTASGATASTAATTTRNLTLVLAQTKPESGSGRA